MLPQLLSKFQNHTGVYTSADARRLARKHVPKIMFDYIDGATGDEVASYANLKAFADVKLRSRVLINTRACSLNKEIMGLSYDYPFGFAPMGMCAIAWPKADTMMAAEALARHIPHGVSTAASSSLEEIQAQTQGRAWFQLYADDHIEGTHEFIDRAEEAGCEVLILTVDTPKNARRIRELKNGFKMPFKIGPKQFIDFALHPSWSLTALAVGAPKLMNFETAQYKRSFGRGKGRSETDWDYLARLRERWPRKLVVKGVMDPEDALKIKNYDADGVYVSNHGGRQLDAARPAIQALPHIREAVGPDYPLIFDSGVRSGEDILKALALGADFVMLGRPLLYAIGATGSRRGLTDYLDGLILDLEVAMAQLGICDINEISSHMLVDP